MDTEMNETELTERIIELEKRLTSLEHSRGHDSLDRTRDSIAFDMRLTALEGDLEDDSVNEGPQAGPNPDQFEPYGTKGEAHDIPVCESCEHDRGDGPLLMGSLCHCCIHLDAGSFGSTDNFKPKGS